MRKVTVRDLWNFSDIDRLMVMILHLIEEFMGQMSTGQSGAGRFLSRA